MITVEDGTGLAGADSYCSTSFADTYHDARGNTAWAAVAAGPKERALVQAAQYIDTIQRYKGTRLTATQALEFPRSGCVDWSGYAATGVPAAVAKACAELALRALTGPLYADLARGGRVTSESLGPISTSYAADAPVGVSYVAAMNLLQQYARQPGIAAPFSTPFVSEASSPMSFGIGMHDFPGGGDPGA